MVETRGGEENLDRRGSDLGQWSEPPAATRAVMSIRKFDLQGHRGARGLRPENTLPSFEAAFDAGVTSVETDVHLTADGAAVLFHDHTISERLCRLRPGASSPDPSVLPPLPTLSLAQLRGYRADRNPDPRRFPGQDAGVTPAAEAFAAYRGLDLYTPPTLDELFAFAGAYAGALGAAAGKTLEQRARAAQVGFGLELKRVPARPGLLGDDYDGSGPALLEQRVVEAVRRAGLLGRTTVRSFDHRCVLHLRALEPEIRTAVLVTGTAPVDPAALASGAGADLYCPDAEFLDELQVRQLRGAGIRVLPWTVNEPDDWVRLLEWGVNGITTDYPDRLAGLLRQREVEF
jgi:glycerophosphoryl diester phosphodiesterase